MKHLSYLPAGVLLILLAGVTSSHLWHVHTPYDNLAQVLSVVVLNPDGSYPPPPTPPVTPIVGSGSGARSGGGTPVVPTAKICSKSKGDLNEDGRVNITDFSILAFWYKRTLTQVALAQCVDQNTDAKVTLADFSILAYYWNK